jgi:hypothetical protein
MVVTNAYVVAKLRQRFCLWITSIMMVQKTDENARMATSIDGLEIMDIPRVSKCFA